MSGDDDETTVELRTSRLLLRTPRPTDRAALEALFACPGVVRWWGPRSEDDIDEALDRSEPEVTVLMLELVDRGPDVDAGTDVDAGPVIGLIQFHEEEDPMYRHAGIDLAIHDDHQRKGLGPEAIRAVVEHLERLGHHRVVIDPNADNAAAIAAYRRVGFSPVGTMRSYEWSEHEQRWTDGLLMELLIFELPDR